MSPRRYLKLGIPIILTATLTRNNEWLPLESIRMSFRTSSALVLIKGLSAFPASSSSSSSSLVSRRACGHNLRSRIKVSEWQREGFSDSLPLWRLQFGQVCSPFFSFDIVGMVGLHFSKFAHLYFRSGVWLGLYVRIWCQKDMCYNESGLCIQIIL